MLSFGNLYIYRERERDRETERALNNILMDVYFDNLSYPSCLQVLIQLEINSYLIYIILNFQAFCT